MVERYGAAGDLKIAFVFVKAGDPPPTAWLAAHPGYIKIPATFVPHRRARPRPLTPPPGSAIPPVMQEATQDDRPPGAHALASGAVHPDAAAWSSKAVGLGIASGAGAAASGAWEGALPAWLGDIGAILGEAAGPLASVGILLYPTATASPELDELHPGRRAFDPHPPMPPVPGLAPPEHGDKPGEGGFTPSAPAPPHAGFDASAPAPGVLPGREAREQEPVVFEQKRNVGLPRGARTNSKRARDAARAADPEVARALSEAEWRAHHLISVAAQRMVPDLLAAAERGGWRVDDPRNMAALPASPTARAKLKDATGLDRPVHDSGHPLWLEMVRERLSAIEWRLNNPTASMSPEGYDQRAAEEFYKLDKALLRVMLKLDRLSQGTSAEGSTYG